MWIPINVTEEEFSRVNAILGCQQSQIPTVYLGLPLTFKKPTKDLYMPLVQKFEKKLEGWKGKLISRGGRLQLVNSVLSSIPIYFMACFQLPKWLISQLDQIRRSFLWGKNEVNKKGVSLINWNTNCLPKKWGGMGVSKLQERNISLLLRWWWRLYTVTDSLWAEIVTLLKKTQSRSLGPKIWQQEGSFFWSNLLAINPLFVLSTWWIIANGKLISYWFDAWNDTPLARQPGLLGMRPDMCHWLKLVC